MRYIRLSTVVHKIFDDVIVDRETIVRILSSLYDGEFSFKLSVSGLPKYDSVRIICMDDDKVKVKIEGRSGRLVKEFYYSEILEIQVNTQVEKLARIKPDKVNRWNMLDPSSDIPEGE